MPTTIEVGGCSYEHVETFKHDFFAATGLYQAVDSDRLVVLKIGRRIGFLGIPLGWTGRFLARHEAEMFGRLADLPGVPALVGRWRDDAIVHDYVPGHALQKHERVDDLFFERLNRMITTMHWRRMAYVDLEKRQNVLIGTDGRPYLIDFQISWPWNLSLVERFRTRWFAWPIRWLERRLQQGDSYHLRKLQRRYRPDLMSPEELAASYQRPWAVRLFRWLTTPARRLRRFVLAKVDPARGEGERGRYDEEASADLSA